MKRRHYITSIFLLLLPVIVIYALTSYDNQSTSTSQENGIEIKQDLKRHCQQKSNGQNKSYS